MQSDSMSNGQDISLQGAYRQDQDAKLEVKPTDYDTNWMIEMGKLVAGLTGVVICSMGLMRWMLKPG